MASLIALIDRLITEHGSASILEKHIALLKDQATLIEKKLLLFESENRVLREENERYKTENSHLDNENVDLKNKLKAQKQTSQDISLPEEQKEILVLLANSDMMESKIIAAIGRGGESVRFDLEELREAELIESQHVPTLGPSFGLTQSGRRYLKKNGLLN